MADKQIDQLIKELVAIKKLLILIMLNNDYTQTDVANALGIDQSAISRMLSKKTERDSKADKTGDSIGE